MGDGMIQYAPYPAVLAELVEQVRYKPGWTFRLIDMPRDRDGDWRFGDPIAGGLTLDIISCTYNSYREYPDPRTADGKPPDYFVHHYKIVPAATFNRESWLRWILDQCLEIEQHEACEFLRVGDERPFAPTHGPGDNPYRIVQYATDEQRRTAFTGALNE